MSTPDGGEAILKFVLKSSHSSTITESRPRPRCEFGAPSSNARRNGPHEASRRYRRCRLQDEPRVIRVAEAQSKIERGDPNGASLSARAHRARVGIRRRFPRERTQTDARSRRRLRERRVQNIRQAMSEGPRTGVSNRFTSRYLRSGPRRILRACARLRSGATGLPRVQETTALSFRLSIRARPTDNGSPFDADDLFERTAEFRLNDCANHDPALDACCNRCTSSGARFRARARSTSVRRTANGSNSTP